MKRAGFILISLLLLFIIPAPILASDVTGAVCYGVLTITNTSSAATNVAGVVSINTTDLIANGFLNSDADNGAIQDTSGNDIPFMPGYGGNNWAVFVPSIGASMTDTNLLYTANSTGGALSYFPGTGGIVVSDTAAIELGSNFQFQTALLADSSLAGNVFNKISAYRLYTTSNNITSSIYGSGTKSQALDDGTAPIGASYYTRTGQKFLSSSYPYTTISSVQIALAKSNAPTGTAYCRVRSVSGDTILGTLGSVDVSTLGGVLGWVTFNSAAVTFDTQDFRLLVEYSGGDAANYISAGDKNTTLTGEALSMYNGSYNDNAAFSLTYQSLTYVSPASTISSALTNTEHTVRTSYDGATHKLFIDDMVTPAASSAWVGTVPNNTSSLLFVSGNSTLYADYLDIDVSGADAARWAWEYGATFTDSISAIVGTPTFRTTSSNAFVTIALTSFQPVDIDQPPAYTVTSGSDFVTGTPTISANFTTSVNSTAPGSDIITAVATAGQTPVQLPFMLISGIILLAASLTTTWGLKRFAGKYGESASGSLFIKVMIIALLWGALSAIKWLDFWMLIIFVIMGVAWAFASRQQTWNGADVSQTGMIGFLGTSFVGMTLLNRIIEGAFITANDVSVLNQLTIFTKWQISDGLSIPVPNVNFISGLFRLVKWDYSYFGGNAEIVKFFLYSFTFVIGFILFMSLISILYNVFKAR